MRLDKVETMIRILVITVGIFWTAFSASADTLVSRVLPNGMEIIVAPDSRTDSVTVEIAVKLGSQYENAATNGLAHLYEHMFWTANRAWEEGADYLKGIAEKNLIFNGITREEVSYFHLTGQGEHLPVMIHYMRDAALFPLFRETDLKREVAIVLDELERDNAPPYVYLGRTSTALLFSGNAAKRPAGDPSVIRNATAEDLRSLHARFVVPGNTALVVSGNCVPSDVFRQAEKLFGSWTGAARLAALTKWPPLEPQVAVRESRDVNQAVIRFSWRGPSFEDDPDGANAADILFAILDAPGSRMDSALVATGLVKDYQISYYTQRNVGVFDLTIACEPEKARDAARAARAEMERLVAMPEYFSDRELRTNRARYVEAERRDNEDPVEYAHTISFWWGTAGTRYLKGRSAALLKVERGAINRFIGRYIRQKPFVSVAVIPAGSGALAEGDLY